MYQITFATLFVAQYNGTFVTYGVIRFVQYTILPVLSDLYKTDTAGISKGVVRIKSLKSSIVVSAMFSFN